MPTKEALKVLVSCSFCGGLHERGKLCQKRVRTKRPTKEANYITKFRSSNLWKRISSEIKKRDKYLCQVCLLDKYNTERKYNFYNLEVHHIDCLRDYFEKRIDGYNLITLCAFHHKQAENGIINRNELLEIAAKNENKM